MCIYIIIASSPGLAQAPGNGANTIIHVLKSTLIGCHQRKLKKIIVQQISIYRAYLRRRPIPPMSSCKLTEPLPSVSNKLKRFSANSYVCMYI